MADESHSDSPERNVSETDVTGVVIDETASDATKTKEGADCKTTESLFKDKSGAITVDKKKDGMSSTNGQREFSLFGRTSSNVHLFVGVFAVTILLRGTVQQYLLAVSRHLQRRYYIEENNLNFAFGVEKITIVGTLLFIGYYGNTAHKPIATFCGAILCAGGTLVCAIPYFISGPLTQEKYLEASRAYASEGLCKAGYDAGFASTAQCDQLPDSLVVSGSFSLLCTGQFLMGLGAALLATLGFMYVEESAAKQHTPLFYGILLGMYGLGDAFGALLALAYTSLPEGLSGDSGAAVWNPGAWWLALPMLFVGLLIPSPVFFLFPRWIKEPRWLVRRHERQRRLEEKREARRLALVQLEKERRRRHRRRKKRELERRKREAAAAAAVAAEENGDVSSAIHDGKTTSGNDRGAVSSSADDLQSTPSTDVGASPDNDQHSASSDPPTAAESKYTEKVDGSSGEADDMKSSDEEREPTTSTETEAIQNERSTTNNKSLTAKHNEVRNSTDDKHRDTDDGGAEEASTRGAGDSEGATETTEANVSKADQRNRKRYALGRKLQDLPRNMSFLLKQPIFSMTLCGTILWAYFPAGYHAILPHYLQSQFQQSEQAAHTTAGVCFGLASSLGVVLSAVATHRWSLKVVRQMALALVAMTVCTVVLCILFAFGCDDAKQMIGTRSVISYFSPICTDSCSCAQSQYEPVCTANHQRFASPCLAGCSEVEITPTLNYFGCSCVSGNQSEERAEVSADWCQTCGTLVPYVLFLFIAVTTHAAVPLPVLLVFLRKVPEKLRSLSLGFSAWMVYLISYSPGYAAFYSIGEEACLLHKKTCYENVHCWQHDNKRHRLLLHGVTVALQVTAMLCFAGSWYKLRLTTKPPAASSATERTDTEQPATIQLETAPTQTSGKSQADSDNAAGSEPDIAEQGMTNFAFSEDQHDIRSSHLTV